MALTKVGLKVQRIQGSIRPIVLFKKILLNTRSINKTNVPSSTANTNLQLQIRLSNLRYFGHKIAGSSRKQWLWTQITSDDSFISLLCIREFLCHDVMGHPQSEFQYQQALENPLDGKHLLRIARVGLCTTAQSKGTVVHVQFNTKERKKGNMSSYFREDARNSGNRMQGTFPYYNLDYTLNHKRKCLSKGYLYIYNVF